MGPGNIYVALAKSRVFGDVGIDMLAGPSEVVVIADAAADPAFVAADLLAQAEHDPMARAVLLTPVGGAARRGSQRRLARQLEALPRREIAASALEANGALVLTASLEEAVDVANRLAPEHLELLVAEPDALLARVRSAGAVFLGGATPEVVGDYVAGPNHVLPTGGTARFASALSHRGLHEAAQRDRAIGPRASRRPGPHVAELARVEGLARPRRGGARAHRDEGRQRMTDKARGTEPAIPRQARVERKTKETQIVLQLGLDGTGASKVETGIPFFNHMLEAWSKHGLMDLAVDAQGRPRGGSPPHGGGRRASAWARRSSEALGDKRGIVALRRVVPADGRGAAARRGRHLRAAVPRLQRAAPADARSSNFDLDLLQGLLPRVRLQRRDHAARQHALRREPPPHRRGDVQGGRPRALAEATPARTRATRRAVPSTKGSLVRAEPSMIAVVDYGRGNLGSVEKAFGAPGHAPRS